jgi:hypothetical protein
MAFETTSVFDIMAADDTDRRVASRRALALAHTRIENQFGSFLRGAVGNDEFNARLAAVEEGVDAHVASAVQENNGGTPEHIKASIVDHYRISRRWQPRESAGMNPMVQQQAQQMDPAMMQQMQLPVDPNTGLPFDPTQQPLPTQAPQQPQQFPGAQFSSVHAAENPSKQVDTSPKTVACPECGGDKKTADGSKCQRCDGKGKVPNFGPSVLDSVAHTAGGPLHHSAASDNETGLGDPEPKMDKRKWTPETVQNIDPGSTQHPNRVKDPLIPIVMTNRDQEGHDLSEIGEQTTVTEELPSNDSDAGFSGGGPGPAPNTQTFPNSGQTKPVSRENQS